MTDETPNTGTEVKDGETAEIVVDDPALPEAPALADDGPGKVIASYQVRVVVRDPEDGYARTLTINELAQLVGTALETELGHRHITVRAERLDK